MKEETIEYILQNDKWPFEKSDIWNRYFHLLFPIVLFFLSISMAIGTGLKGDKSISTTFIVCFCLFLFLIALYFTFYILTRIKKERLFYTVEFKWANKNLIGLSICELGWNIQEENDKYIIASTPINWKSTTWGEVITIIFNGNNLLFNARANTRQGLTGNRDSVHFWKFYNVLKEKKLISNEIELKTY